ncbi:MULTISPECIES: PilN domain-containing protein [Rhodanobacter]|uniref:Tfp pilus assembly protein PilN n=1 Tax=Rhodanobacter denitrificans TaxID=666685 RepID=M4NJZ2_9GAMM|nr:MULTISPECIES: PilN domain-containing protein [Rhodanobacter]AGG90407.1 Tfp pilus assembly protein PilN [Rhodanobacter denitrificans]UJM85791.1 PilN domain-containing protein [Rhodanobacter denitrificans]
MAHVNLLPWRVARRKQREREFYMQLAAAFVAGLGVLLLWVFWMDQRIDNQNDRNTYLQTEIKQLDVRIAKIKDLEKVREHLLARKQIIEQLQADRSQMVHLFDELVKTIPASARLSGLKQNGQSMSLDGVAQSNASVAEYMRNIEGSPWMGHADLRKTENTHNGSRMPYVFGLNVTLSKPKADEADGKTPVLPNAAGTAAASTAPAAAAKAATASPAKPAATTAPEVKPVSAPAATGGARS